MFNDQQARRAWNKGAEAWEQFVESGADYYRHEVHGPALLSACEPLCGVKVLDLGCGQGFFSREMARRGAEVVGIDLAERLIQFAQGHEARQPLGIRYVHGSASEASDCWPPATFDLVAACMSLQDMADIDAALKAAYRVLRPDGRMVFSVPHPATDTRYREWKRSAHGEKICLMLDGYFETGVTETDWNMPRLRYRWKTPCRRLTISQWCDAVLKAGFEIGRLDEPHPSAELAARRPEVADCRRMPYFLIWSLSKKA